MSSFNPYIQREHSIIHKLMKNNYLRPQHYNPTRASVSIFSDMIVGSLLAVHGGVVCIVSRAWKTQAGHFIRAMIVKPWKGLLLN